MADKKLEDYQYVMQDLIALRKAKNDILTKINEIVAMEYALPSTVTDTIAGIMSINSTDAADSLVAAEKVLGNARVEFETIPPAPKVVTQGQPAEDMDVWMEYEWRNMNKRGVSLLTQMAHSAVQHGVVAMQLEYLPRKFKDEKGPRKKAMLRNGNYAPTLHDALTVFPEYSSYGLERVGLRKYISLQSCIDEYGESVCKPLVTEANKLNKDKIVNKRDVMVTVFDLTDYVNRYVWAAIGDVGPENMDATLIEGEHELSFLNWVYRETDPILKLLALSKENDNYNILLALQMHAAIALSATPRSITKTIDGKGVEVDHTDVGGSVNLKLGEEFTPNQLPPPNPSTENEITRRQATLARTTQVSQSLTQLDQFIKGTAFATINALRESGVAGLGNVSKIMQMAIQDMFYLCVEWAKKHGQPVTAYRGKTVDKLDPTKMTGSQITVDFTDIEPSEWEITVTFTPDTLTDKQGRVQLAQLYDSVLHLGHDKIWETAGVDGAEMSHQNWQDQQVELARVMGAAEVTKQEPILKQQLEFQTALAQMQAGIQQQMQQQQAQQQQAQQQGQPQQGGPVPATQGMTNTRQTGTAAYNPGGSTPVAASGQDATGAGVA